MSHKKDSLYNRIQLKIINNNLHKSFDNNAYFQINHFKYYYIDKLNLHLIYAF